MSAHHISSSSSRHTRHEDPFTLEPSREEKLLEEKLLSVLLRMVVKAEPEEKKGKGKRKVKKHATDVRRKSTKRCARKRAGRNRWKAQPAASRSRESKDRLKDMEIDAWGSPMTIDALGCKPAPYASSPFSEQSSPFHQQASSSVFQASQPVEYSLCNSQIYRNDKKADAARPRRPRSKSLQERIKKQRPSLCQIDLVQKGKSRRNPQKRSYRYQPYPATQIGTAIPSFN